MANEGQPLLREWGLSLIAPHSSSYWGKHSLTDAEDPLAGVIIAVRVAGEYHETLPRGLQYLTMAGPPFLAHVEEFRVTVLGYVVEEKLLSVFFEIEIALIISREAVIEDHIVALMPAKSCEVRRSFELLI